MDAPGIAVGVGATTDCDGAEAVELGLSPDVHLAVLDLAMPRLTRLQAAHVLSRRRPELPVLMLSMYDKEQYPNPAIAGPLRRRPV